MQYHYWIVTLSIFLYIFYFSYICLFVVDIEIEHNISIYVQMYNNNIMVSRFLFLTYQIVTNTVNLIEITII